MIAQEDSSPAVSYFKRFRMELDLQSASPPPPALPPSYFWLPWDDDLLDLFSDVKSQCFADEIDAMVFPSLGSREGCRSLMEEIRKKPGFKPEATWLIGHGDGFCATVQGVRDRSGCGAIQNLGVIPSHRGRGLGAALVLQALHGFRRASCHKAVLEVTAQNEGALRLYRRLGFRCRRTIYKVVTPFTGLHTGGSFTF